MPKTHNLCKKMAKGNGIRNLFSKMSDTYDSTFEFSFEEETQFKEILDNLDDFDKEDQR